MSDYITVFNIVKLFRLQRSKSVYFYHFYLGNADKNGAKKYMSRSLSKFHLYSL